VRRYLIAFATLGALLVIHAVGPAGGARHTAGSKAVPSAQRSGTASTQTAMATRTTPTVTTRRTHCDWRRYADGAIGPDPDCAPGTVNPAVPGHVGQTICNRAWLATARRLQPSRSTKDGLLIEYRLPGNPATYVVAHVVPAEDGGSPTSALNLYPLPLNGYGGQETRTLVADQLHVELCSHKITVADAAKKLEGDWLSTGLPDHD
jgi:hypothetical protein